MLTSAMELATKFSADLSVVVVNAAIWRSPRGPHALNWAASEAHAILDDGSERVTGSGQKPVNAAVVVAREASTGIIDHALQDGFDAIVIGTGDKRGLSRLFLGSFAVDVANRAPCTVIIAR